MLQTKCIKAPMLYEDGARVSIMSRHTLNDGLTPDPEITRATYDAWQQALAPDPRLLGDYYKRGMPWQEFETAFQDQLRTGASREALIIITDLAVRTTVTLLCVEESPEFCHRRLVAEESKLLVPGLTVAIN